MEGHGGLWVKGRHTPWKGRWSMQGHIGTNKQANVWSSILICEMFILGATVAKGLLLNTEQCE